MAAAPAETNVTRNEAIASDLREPLSSLGLFFVRLWLIAVLGLLVLSRVWEFPPGAVFVLCVAAVCGLGTEVGFRWYWWARRTVATRGVPQTATIVRKSTTMRGALRKLLVEFQWNGRTQCRWVYLSSRSHSRFGIGEQISIRWVPAGILSAIPPVLAACEANSDRHD